MSGVTPTGITRDMTARITGAMTAGPRPTGMTGALSAGVMPTGTTGAMTARTMTARTMTARTAGVLPTGVLAARATGGICVIRHHRTASRNTAIN